jgi:hypothetical protein
MNVSSPLVTLKKTVVLSEIFPEPLGTSALYLADETRIW